MPLNQQPKLQWSAPFPNGPVTVSVMTKTTTPSADLMEAIVVITLATVGETTEEPWYTTEDPMETTEEPMGDCAAPQWFGDNYCDDMNNTPECGFDGGDCCDNEMEGYDNYCSDCECLE